MLNFTTTRGFNSIFVQTYSGGNKNDHYHTHS